MEERKEEINELTFDLTTKNLGKARITKFLLPILYLNSYAWGEVLLTLADGLCEDDSVLICRSFWILVQ